MSVTPTYDGACLVRIAIPGVSGGALMDLGYSEDGVTPDLNAMWADVHGDENGGNEGPPIEVQWLGEIAVVRMTLTKFDVAVATLVSQRTAAAAGGTAGVLDTPGRMMFTENNAMRLLLKTPQRPLNFTRAFPRGPISANKSVKYQKFICEFECHKDANGVLYNATIS